MGYVFKTNILLAYYVLDFVQVFLKITAIVISQITSHFVAWCYFYLYLQNQYYEMRNKYSLVRLAEKLKTKQLSLNFLREHGVLPNSVVCSKCNATVTKTGIK